VFTTGPGPVVTAQVPDLRDTDLAPSGNVTVAFNEAAQGVDDTTFTLQDADGDPVAATVTYDAATKRATLDPDADLDPDSRYTATLESRISDAMGNPIVRHSWYFTTGPGPSVTARTPGGSGVARGSNITATFSEPVQGRGASTFMVVGPDGKRVPAAIRWDAGTKTATLDPVSALRANSRFTVQIVGGPGGVRDAVGNTMPTLKWAFTTGSR
jgi:hypothetical protein